MASMKSRWIGPKGPGSRISRRLDMLDGIAGSRFDPTWMCISICCLPITNTNIIQYIFLNIVKYILMIYIYTYNEIIIQHITIDKSKHMHVYNIVTVTV